jgi:hypothetical protein
MSFAVLRDIFAGRFGTDYCVKSLLFLKSPNNVKEYLVGIHKVTFPDGDKDKNKKWRAYPRVVGTSYVIPIREKDLSNPLFMNKQADKLSFDISRFTEFLTGYNKVDEDIKPAMLHYATIYLFDFFTRTWLKYGQNWGHGIRQKPREKGSSVNECLVEIGKNGIFPRVIDAFYLLGQSSLFSPDDDSGIGYTVDVKGGTISERIEKMRYSETPKIRLIQLTDVYEKLGKIVGTVSKSNPILVGYVILFIMSSISRYNADDWFKIREDRNFRSKFELLQHDVLYNWIPEILLQTILKKGLKKELSLSSE